MFNNLLKRSQKHIFAIYCKVRRIHVESSLVVQVHMFTIHCIIQRMPVQNSLKNSKPIHCKHIYSTTCVNGHSQKYLKMVSKTNYRLIQVKSISK